MRTTTWYKVSLGCPARDIDVRLEAVEVYAETDKCVRTIAVSDFWPQGFRRLEKKEKYGVHKFFRNFEEARGVAVGRAAYVRTIYEARANNAEEILLNLTGRTP